jgi:hypothetical protein
MVPKNGAPWPLVNVTDAMDEQPRARTVSLPVSAMATEADPFGEVEV